MLLAPRFFCTCEVVTERFGVNASVQLDTRLYMSRHARHPVLQLKKASDVQKVLLESV